MKQARNGQAGTTSNDKFSSAQKQNAVAKNLEQMDVDVPEKVSMASEVSKSDSDSDESSYEAKVKSSFEQYGASVENLAAGLSGVALSEVKETLRHAKETIEHFKNTVNGAKETISQARSTVETIRGSAKQVLKSVKENPEPFISATVPGLIGAYLLFEKARKFASEM